MAKVIKVTMHDRTSTFPLTDTARIVISDGVLSLWDANVSDAATDARIVAAYAPGAWLAVASSEYTEETKSTA